MMTDNASATEEIARDIFGEDWTTVTLLKTQVAIPSEKRAFDTIIYRNSLWLVSGWASAGPARRRPRLMIGGAGVTFEAWRGMGLLGRVNSTSPSTLFAGHIPDGEEALFIIEREPDVDFPGAAE